LNLELSALFSLLSLTANRLKSYSLFFPFPLSAFSLELSALFPLHQLYAPYAMRFFVTSFSYGQHLDWNAQNHGRMRTQTCADQIIFQMLISCYSIKC
jgi:hypothetical protein